MSAGAPSWDTVVVGAGPAGCVAAHGLAKAGRAVALVERSTFPRYKVCGGCLNLRAFSVLERCGLAEAVLEAGAQPLSKMRLASRGRSANLTLPGGWAISRQAFDAVLAREAQAAGAVFYEATRAVLGAIEGQRRALTLYGPTGVDPVAAHMIVAADGLGQRLLAQAEGRDEFIDPHARIGAGVLLKEGPAFYEPGVIYMACHRHGYVGLVRVEDDRLNVAAAFDPLFVRESGGLHSASLVVLEAAGMPALALAENEEWKGTPPLTRTSHRRHSERLIVVGDAMGYVEPFTGEGMAWAMSAAQEALPFIGAAIEGDASSAATSWSRHARRMNRMARLRCRTLAAGLRRPALVGAAIRALAIAPSLSAPIVGRLNHPVSTTPKESP